jgi:hypothetical protein
MVKRKSVTLKAPTKKRQLFGILFIVTQLFLVFFYIHHQSALIKLSYQKQKYEKKKVKLAQTKQQLKHALHAQHDLAHIKEFALESHMQKIGLHQIKPVPQ